MSDFMFAYGSNMCQPRLQARIGSTRFSRIGQLKGYKYSWHKPGDDGSGKGNIIYTGNDQDAVWGSLYSCTSDELIQLDGFEGVGGDPGCYQRMILPVDTHQGTVDAYVYIAPSETCDPALPPYDWYHAIVIAGAVSADLPADYINFLSSTNHQADLDRQRWLTHMTEARILAPFRSIGTIHTPFKSLENMPIQPAGARDIKGHITLEPHIIPAADDLQGFSHAFLLYYFHESNGFRHHVTPFLDKTKRGLFATRAPCRPNAIGQSLVRILNIENNRITIADVDILDGTPLLDIKPFVPEFDSATEVRFGWLESVSQQSRTIRSDTRFIGDEPSDEPGKGKRNTHE